MSNEMKKMTTYVPQQYYEQIEELANNLDISNSKAHTMILASGLSNWETEIRITQLEAKLDLVMENFALEDDAKERMEEAVIEFNEEKSTDISIDESGEPTDAMKSIGISPDTWEK